MFALFRRNPAFRAVALFVAFGGIGRGMFAIVSMWAVHAAFHSAWYTAIAGFLLMAPRIVGVVVGPLVDRWDKARVLRVVEWAKFAVLAALLAAHLTTDPAPALYFTVIAVFSTLTVFMQPALAAVIPRVVADGDLLQANVVMEVLAIAGGVVMGGALLAMSAGDVNFTAFYVLNAALLAAAALVTLSFRDVEAPAVEVPAVRAAGGGVLRTYLAELREGLTFVRRGAMFVLTVATMAIFLAAEVAYVNFPQFIEVHLGSAFTYMLFSILALTGAMIGNLVCQAVAKVPLWKVLTGAMVVAGVARVVFVVTISPRFAAAVVAYLLYIGLWAAFDLYFRLLVQKLPPKEMVGRVSAATTSLAFGAGAVGALLGGLVGTHFHVDVALLVQAVALVGVGVFVATSRRVRALGSAADLKGSTAGEPAAESRETADLRG